ncbi:hypothetical protein E1B28_003778 [Marasmius oreades]|uniref:Uncharacterized protein n=1 Tax=Marasmius oreades TaxID=181124 RepID=A0A9P7UX93_9AGAR|nr:uncharacterized protein E1B28_003778 [Marasmius oreades]KAG7096334.1 hypothetical protein E1B28_003778 [Marasmius oreades]
MFFKSATIISTLAVLFVGQAMGSALIAGPVSACGPPNNGDHHAGSSCKFYSSDSSSVISGTCVVRDGTLTCVA